MNILKEFYENIKEIPSLKKVLSIPQFMNFLLEEALGGENLSGNGFYKLFNHTMRLSEKTLTALEQSKDWSFERFEKMFLKNSDSPKRSDWKTRIFKVGKEILAKHAISLSDNTDLLSSVIQPMVFLHFFNTPTPSLLFQRNFPCSCYSYIPWAEKESQLNDALKRTSLIFLSGNPGTGKRQLIIHALEKSYSLKYSDIYWLNVRKITSLKESLMEIAFRDNSIKELSTKEVLFRLKEKDNTSLLVIHKPILSNNDISFIKKNLSTLRLRIIISTYTKIFVDDFTAFTMDNRPIMNLYKIFKAHNPSCHFTHDEFKILANNVSNNVYVITLIGKALSSSSNILNKEQLLNRFESLYYEPRLSKAHSSYHDSQEFTAPKSGQLLLSLINRILSDYPEDILCNELSKLSIWTITPISICHLKTQWKEELLDTWLRYGLLQNYDNNKLYMPKLLADIIWRNNPINYQDYKNEIKAFLYSISCGKPCDIPYTDLYEIIFNMLIRFHFQINITSSRPTKAERNTILQWNHLLIDVMQHYMQLGDYKYAQKLLPLIYVTRTKRGKANEKKDIETAIRQLLDLQTTCMEGLNISVINKLITEIAAIKEKCSYNSLDYSEIIYYLFVCIIQNFCDLAIEYSLQSISDILEEKLAPDSTKIQLYLLPLVHCGTIMKNANMQSCHYYLSASCFIASASGLQNQWEAGLQHLCDFLSLLPNEDVSFKAHCLRFYFSLYFLSLEAFTMEQQEIAYESAIERFIELYKIFKGNIWSYHTSYIFYSCASFLATMLPKNAASLIC